MKHLIINFSVLMLLMITPVLAQDQKPLEGIVLEVIDGQEVPVIGANVYWKDTSIGTVTDDNGQFTISNVSRGPYTFCAAGRNGFLAYGVFVLEAAPGGEGLDGVGQLNAVIMPVKAQEPIQGLDIDAAVVVDITEFNAVGKARVNVGTESID